MSWFFASSAALEKKILPLQVLEGGFLDLRGLETWDYISLSGGVGCVAGDFSSASHLVAVECGYFPGLYGLFIGQNWLL